MINIARNVINFQLIVLDNPSPSSSQAKPSKLPITDLNDLLKKPLMASEEIAKQKIIHKKIEADHSCDFRNNEENDFKSREVKEDEDLENFIKNEDLNQHAWKVNEKQKGGAGFEGEYVKRKHSLAGDDKLLIRNATESFEDKKRARFEQMKELPLQKDLSPLTCNDVTKDEQPPLPSGSFNNLPIPKAFKKNIEAVIMIIGELNDIIGAITSDIIKSLESAKSCDTNRGNQLMLNDMRISFVNLCQDRLKKSLQENNLESNRVKDIEKCIEHLEILKTSPNILQPDVMGWDKHVEFYYPYFLSFEHFRNYHQDKAWRKKKPFVKNIVHLSTVLLIVRGITVDWHVARCLLDSGCQQTVMTRSLAEELGFDLTGVGPDVSAASGVKVKTLGNVIVEIASRYQPLR